VRRLLSILTTSCLVVGASFAAAPAEGSSLRQAACGAQAYSYAGLQADETAHGVSATLSAAALPSVRDGHVAGWIGLGGPKAGPDGTAEWIQTGYSAFPADTTSRIYYEVAVPGAEPRYVELSHTVAVGTSHKFAVLEMAQRQHWWRVWLDDRPVSPPIHLPTTGGAWYPQAVAENWNGGTGACNSFSYRFANVMLAGAEGGDWRSLGSSYAYQDPGYHVVPISTAPRSFLAASVAA
jgi:hypothetical protein